MNEIQLDCGYHTTHFAQHFWGERRKVKFDKLNSSFIHFRFKSKKVKPRKKDKGKLVPLEFHSRLFSTILKKFWLEPKSQHIMPLTEVQHE